MPCTRFDLHLHSALSACAEDVLSPRQIVDRALHANLDMIAITDHNASAHASLVSRLGHACGLTVVPGMEVTTREEVHVLAFLPDIPTLEAFQATIDRALPQAQNDSEHFGWQLVYDENDEIVDVDERLRQIGTDIGIDELVAHIRACGGCAVPAHVYRHRNSLTSQLGFVAPDSGYDAVEVSVRTWRREGLQLGDRIAGYPVVVGSDSHFIEDIGRFALEVPQTVHSVPQLLGALRRLEGA
jgi:predicted metal-dependent phosphoesterase TrpH